MTVHQIRLRMYNVGFGDAFVLSVDHDDGTWRMLVDCGVHTGGGSGHTISEIVDQIIADLVAEGVDPPHLDVVVATHRHRDHVSGFERKAWDDVTVGEVWLPFTENPDDELGRSILQQQSRKAQRLHMHLVGLAAVGDKSAAKAATVVENSLTNAVAMDRLHQRFKGSPKRRYFPNPGVEPARFRAAGRSEITVHMLGPRRDKSVIASMDPPADERWLGAMNAKAPANGETPAPVEPLFDPAYAVTPDTIRLEYPDLLLDDKTQKALAESATFDAWAAAASITDAVNNTSLVFVLEIEDVKLLFPGDAQWGLWAAILADADSAPALADTTLYKVGHHGSHNATHTRYARQFMGDETISMMSFHKVEDWPSIPDGHLVTALGKGRRRLIRSDEKKAQRGVRWNGTLSAEYTIKVT